MLHSMVVKTELFAEYMLIIMQPVFTAEWVIKNYNFYKYLLSNW